MFPLQMLLLTSYLVLALAQATSPTAINIKVNISGLFNNKASRISPGSGGNFDGNGTTIPANFLPSNPNFYHRGFNVSPEICLNNIGLIVFSLPLQISQTQPMIIS